MGQVSESSLGEPGRSGETYELCFSDIERRMDPLLPLVEEVGIIAGSSATFSDKTLAIISLSEVERRGLGEEAAAIEALNQQGEAEIKKLQKKIKDIKKLRENIGS